MYEYILVNGVWKIYWGGQVMHPQPVRPPAETPRPAPVVLVTQAG